MAQAGRSSGRIGTAGVYIVIGVTIGSLLTAVGRGSRS